MYLTLRHKINSAICVTFIVIAMVFAAIQLPFQKHRFERSVAAIEMLLYTLVERDSEQLANEIFDKRLRAIDIRIAEMMEVEGILAIAVYDDTGRQLATKVSHLPDHHPVAVSEMLSSVRGGPRQESTVWQEQERLHFLRDITFLEERLGGVHIVYSLKQVKEDQRNSLLIFVGLLLTILLTMLVALNVILSRAILRPIVNLRNAAHSIAEGNLDQDIDKPPSEELSSLAVSFEKMRDAVKEKIVKQQTQIDERKRAEDNLQITLNSIGDGVITTDVGGRITGVNPIAEKLTGWSQSEARGKKLVEVFAVINGVTREPVKDPAERVLKSGGIEELKENSVLLSRNGREYPINDSGAPIRSHEGEILGVVLVFRDVSEEKALQDQLRQSQKMDAIGQLAGGVAHDFNNMLGGIMGASEMLALRLGEDQKALKYNSIILESAKRAADLTNKLLTFSRSNPQVSTVVDLHEIIEESVVLLRNTVDRRIEIIIKLAAESSTVVGDPTLLQNALLNLGINSSHAMPEGGVIRITTGLVELDADYCQASSFALQPGTYFTIEFGDNGMGIAFEHRDKIFDPFFTTKGQGHGTGLGLAAVYGTVKQHGGAIYVDSEIELGTVFRIVMPLARGKKTTPAVSPAVQKGRGCILVVDDEEVMRITAGAILEDLGYKVEMATNGHEALTIFEQKTEEIDLVLLDMVMPVMNGRDCFAALRQLDPDIPVVVSSGFTREEDLKEMKLKGLNAFIRKPYLSASLSRTIHDVLQA